MTCFIQINSEPKKFPVALILLPMLLGVTGCMNTVDDSLDFTRSDKTVELAVMGDVPYHDSEIGEFPNLVESINNDPFVTTVVHVGDIKAGDTLCSDERYQNARWSFLSFVDPLIYTPGDNEWVDCHRDINGAYEPEERLNKLREVFFDVPVTSIGGRILSVEAQSGFPENQSWHEKGITFGTLHVVGSNNNLKSGAGIPGPVEQTATGSSEYGRRTAANITWLRKIFSDAIENQSAGLAIFLHADMWKLQTQFEENNFGGFRQIVEELAIQAASFNKPVLLVSGDNHYHRVDAGVHWFNLYGVTPVSNVTQVIVERGIVFCESCTTRSVRRTWLRLLADATAESVFSWELVTEY